ncbi:isoprenylcysteine carboxylmethyltransferase family protein [Photobacterium japonica]|uniref:methyltransferase family protein n=1 Tax=Photobacterium japonica TaxID=2910235 RepID=UPI003D0B8C36
MELRLPPPLILLLTLVGMYALTQYWPLFTFGFHGQWWVSGGLCLMGVILGLAGVRAFAVAQTTIDPRYPNKTSKLVTTGIYQYTRNPMYLALLCFLIAAFVYFSALSNVIMLLFFVLYMNHFQIAAEEAVLEAMFGERYTKYCQEVRRWF